jgi:hypothetical protein
MQQLNIKGCILELLKAKPKLEEDIAVFAALTSCRLFLALWEKLPRSFIRKLGHD